MIATIIVLFSIAAIVKIITFRFVTKKIDEETGRKKV